MSSQPVQTPALKTRVKNPIGRSRRGPLRQLAHWAVTIGIFVMVGALLVRNMSGLQDVGAALAEVSGTDVVMLLVLTAIIQGTYAWQYSAGLPGLRFTRGLVCFEGQTAVSNLIPGPSGTATRLMMLHTWGFSIDDFARLWLITSAITNLLVLAMPAVAVILLAIDAKPPSGLAWGLAGLGVLVAAISVVVVLLSLRSERLAARVGTICGRVIVWARGIAHRPPTDQDFAQAALDLRTDLINGWHACGVRVTIACFSNYVAQGLLLLVSVRSVGLDESIMPLGAVALVYVMYRLLTIVQITPGGVGVNEAILATIMLMVTDGAYSSQIAASIVLFRGLTYAAPILLGGVALIVWRFAGRWRVAPPTEDVGKAAVANVMMDRDPPAPEG